MTLNLSNRNFSEYTRKKIQHFSYALSDKIGKGYSSQVYKGRHDHSQQPVAIKVIDMKMLKNQIHRQLLQDQIQILRELKDLPNVLNFQQVYTTKNNTYIITQLCQSDLDAKIKKKLTQQEAFYYIEQVIQGYLQIQSKQIIHRDLKPPNILVTDNNQCKIADFGFAIKSHQLDKINKYNVGSPLYMAPQSLKNNQYSFKSDIWSIGVIFFELLTGQTPWKCKTEKDLLRRMEIQTIDHIIQRKNIRMSEKSLEFLRKCLCVNQQKRMSPYQLRRFQFTKSQINRNVLTESNRNNQNLLLNKSLKIKPSVIIPKYPIKSEFTREDQQNAVQVRSLDNTLRKHNSIYKRDKYSNENPENQNENQQQSPQFTMISKQLISQIHFSRFLFKIISKVNESKANGILKDQEEVITDIKQKYTQFIKHKIKNVSIFSQKNILDIPTQLYLRYRKSSDSKRITKISKEYCEKYQTQLSSFWNTQFNKKFTSEETTELIARYISLLHDKNDGFFSQVNNYQNDIITLDYLITAKQMIDLLKNGENYEKFSRKCKVDLILEASAVDITEQLAQKIIQRGKFVLVSA